jgi:hypothetical protein
MISRGCADCNSLAARAFPQHFHPDRLVLFANWTDPMRHSRLSSLLGAAFVGGFLVLPLNLAAALPPRIIPKEELVIIQREEEVSSATSTDTPEDKPKDNVQRFLPPEKLVPLIVHPKYYSRDLEFQAQAIPSGRYLHVVKHPHTKKRCKVKIVLPDGAPVVVHRKHSITYLYPSQRVVVDFGFFGRSCPKVHYRNGQGTFRAIHERLGNAKQSARSFIVKLPFTGAVKDNGRKVKDTGKGAFAAAGEGGKIYFETLGKLIDGFPGVKTLQGLGKQLPARGRQDEIKQAGESARRQAPEFIPTNR